jgi:hypothetical protein
MADISDVTSVLVAVAAQAIYPNGMGQPSVAGVPVRIYEGWPDANTLDADMQALNAGGEGFIHVSVYPRPEETKTTRYEAAWRPLSTTPATLTLTLAGHLLTVGGTVSTPQNLAVLANGSAYTYAAQVSDTLTSIATALAALIPGATSSGAVVTLPSGVTVTAARAGGTGQMLREVRRQNRTIQLTVWANSPTNRTAVAKPLDDALAGMEFITLLDGTGGRLLYRSSPISDALSKVQIYRRDLFYTVEYATTQVTQTTEVVVAKEIFGTETVDGTVNTTNTFYE